MNSFNTLMVTGGAGFIGSDFIRYLFRDTDFAGKIINFDLLTYAGNTASLADIAREYSGRYHFIQGTICEQALVEQTISEHKVDCIYASADRS